MSDTGDRTDPRTAASSGAHAASDGRAAAAQTFATIYIGDQLARIADVLEESAKVGGIAHAVPTTILEIVRALDRGTATTIAGDESV